MTLSLNAALAPGACATQVWDIDSETGVGATQLRLTVALAAYGNGTCGATGAGRHDHGDRDLGRRGLTPTRLPHHPS